MACSSFLLHEFFDVPDLPGYAVGPSRAPGQRQEEKALPAARREN